MFWFVLSQNLLSRHRSEFRIPGFGCNSTPGAHCMAVYVRERFHSFGRASWSVLVMSLVCFVFAVVVVVVVVVALGTD